MRGEREMRKGVLLFLAFILLFQSALLAAIAGRFMRYPDIHNNTIVFNYEGDLWSVPSSGGLATRLTSHPGNEYAAKISPEGKWIAFTGDYDRGDNVYLIPMDGGAPKRLTYHGSRIQTVAWTPDGKKVVYRSSQENTYRPITALYAVSSDATMPDKLPIPRGVLCSFSPDGKKLVYNPRGNEEYYWKRYKGGQYQDIWLYDLATKNFTPLTDYVGKNSYPMWIGDWMYFVSDRGDKGIANLYRYHFASKKIEQVTRYEDFDVQMPSTDGRQIVYLHSGYLHVLDTSTNQSQRVEVSIPTDQWQLAERSINPKDYIHSMSISNDGKTVALEARGDLLLVPTDENLPTHNLTGSSDSRERFPQISPDGKWLAFFSDKSGEYQLYMKSLESEGDWIRLTNDLDRTVYHLEWSPDSKKILFGNKDFSIFYVDVESKKLIKIDSSNQLKNDEFYWEISDYSWSPDSKWVTYSFVQPNRNSKIFLYSLEQNKSYPLTDEFYDCLNPSFDGDGEYLYFLSYRNYDVRMDIFEDNHVIPNPVQVMVVQLRAGQKPPFEKVPKQDEEKKEDKEKAETKKKEEQPFRIDLAGIQDRIFPLPVKAGNYFYLKAGKGKVTWAAADNFGESEYEEIFTPGGADKWDLHIFDMKEQKDVTLESRISDWRLSANREHMLIKKKGDYHVTKVEKAFSSKSLGDKLNLEKMIYQVKPREEWAQIFNDTWRWYWDFFYDPNMHGRDWQRMGKTYRSYLPELNSRNDLNWLLSQMVGELCVSHTYIGGGDTGPQKQPEKLTYTGLLGADLQADESTFYRFKTIYGSTEYNRDLKAPLARPDINIKEGDYLISIDGQEIKYPNDPYKLLQVTKGQKVKIVVNSNPTATGAKTYEVEPVESEYMLKYHRWLADNIAKVLRATNNEVGYMHITAMGSGNVGQFDRYWRAFRYKKGLIIDVRGNGGGWTEYFIIDKLERKMVAYNCLKNMVPFRYPGSTSTGQYVVISNEYNGSDGEAFVEHFKARKLGTVVGVPSWGGLVGIVNAQKTIDNGTVWQSNNAFYGQEGKWLVENHGADPDIWVEDDPASAMAGHDRQLEKAMEVVLQQIKEHPFVFPEKPTYPVK